MWNNRVLTVVLGILFIALLWLAISSSYVFAANCTQVEFNQDSHNFSVWVASGQEKLMQRLYATHDKWVNNQSQASAYVIQESRADWARPTSAGNWHVQDARFRNAAIGYNCATAEGVWINVESNVFNPQWWSSTQTFIYIVDLSSHYPPTNPDFSEYVVDIKSGKVMQDNNQQGSNWITELRYRQ